MGETHRDFSATDAVESFLRALASDLGEARPVEAITRDDALDFRRWWQAHVDGGLAANTANNCFGHLSDLVRT